MSDAYRNLAEHPGLPTHTEEYGCGGKCLEKDAVVEATTGSVVCAPASLRWEVGNAATAGVKRRRLTPERARQLVTDFEHVTIRELAIDLERAVNLGLDLGNQTRELVLQTECDHGKSQDGWKGQNPASGPPIRGTDGGIYPVEGASQPKRATPARTRPYGWFGYHGCRGASPGPRGAWIRHGPLSVLLARVWCTNVNWFRAAQRCRRPIPRTVRRVSLCRGGIEGRTHLGAENQSVQPLGFPLLAVMAVPIQTTGHFSAGRPARVFDTKYSGNFYSYDVTPDGLRFLMMKESTVGDPNHPARLVVVLNWFEELRRRVPSR